MHGAKSTTLTRQSNFYDALMRRLFATAAALLAVILFSILIFIGQEGLRTFATVSPGEFFFSTIWNPPEGHFGALSFISGSFFVTLLAALFAAPLGIAGAVFIVKIAPRRVAMLMEPTVALYTAIPSVVYGFIGLTFVVPFVRRIFGLPSGFGLFSAAFILGVMILPTIASISAEAIRAVPGTLEEASIAMGATSWQTIRHIILPAAKPGLLTAVILGMGRAIGETMAVEMVIGNAPKVATSLFAPASAITSEIVMEMGNAPLNSAWNSSLFLLALVLLLISLGLILAIRKVAARGAAL